MGREGAREDFTWNIEASPFELVGIRNFPRSWKAVRVCSNDLEEVEADLVDARWALGVDRHCRVVAPGGFPPLVPAVEVPV